MCELHCEATLTELVGPPILHLTSGPGAANVPTNIPCFGRPTCTQHFVAARGPLQIGRMGGGGGRDGDELWADFAPDAVPRQEIHSPYPNSCSTWEDVPLAGRDGDDTSPFASESCCSDPGTETSSCGNVKKSSALSAMSEDYRETARRADTRVTGQDKLFAYKPGSLQGRAKDLYQVPDVITLLVVGLRGSGKSALINRILDVLEVESAKKYRAPLSGSDEDCGTYFLSEYLTCNGSVSLFDTRGFTEAEVSVKNGVAREWMARGVRDGQMELRFGDRKVLQEELNWKGRLVDQRTSIRREVNYVLFVVNAFDFMTKWKDNDRKSLSKLKLLYDNPFLHFRDDRPIVVMTHMDLLSAADRSMATSALTKELKVSPMDHICALSGSPVDEEEDADRIVELLNVALQKAEWHLRKRTGVSQQIMYCVNNGWIHLRRMDRRVFEYIGFYVLVVVCIYLCSLLLKKHTWPFQCPKEKAFSKFAGKKINLKFPHF